VAGITTESIIWVAGESSGKTSGGEIVDIPADIIPSGVFVVLSEDFASTAYVDNVVSNSASDATLAVATLRSELVASGYLF
jgi:hypothetical protein